jgi:anti-sigma B factor antagonist
MSIHSMREGETVVVGIEGQLIAGNRQQLRDAITSEIDRGARRFIIDFAETGYIDSAGLGALVSLSKRIRESDGTLRLRNLNDDLRTLFELTKLDTLFALDKADRPADTGVGADLPPAAASPRSGVQPLRRPDDDARA